MRPRKLLLHKREIAEIRSLMEQKGYTLVPLKMYFSKGKAKIELGLAKGKSHSDKRQSVKSKEEDRKMAQAMKRDRK